MTDEADQTAERAARKQIVVERLVGGARDHLLALVEAHRRGESLVGWLASEEGRATKSLSARAAEAVERFCARLPAHAVRSLTLSYAGWQVTVSAEDFPVPAEEPEGGVRMDAVEIGGRIRQLTDRSPRPNDAFVLRDAAGQARGIYFPRERTEEVLTRYRRSTRVRAEVITKGRTVEYHLVSFVDARDLDPANDSTSPEGNEALGAGDDEADAEGAA